MQSFKAYDAVLSCIRALVDPFFELRNYRSFLRTMPFEARLLVPYRKEPETDV